MNRQRVKSIKLKTTHDKIMWARSRIFDLLITEQISIGTYKSLIFFAEVKESKYKRFTDSLDRYSTQLCEWGELVLEMKAGDFEGLILEIADVSEKYFNYWKSKMLPLIIEGLPDQKEQLIAIYGES